MLTLVHLNTLKKTYLKPALVRELTSNCPIVVFQPPLSFRERRKSIRRKHMLSRLQQIAALLALLLGIVVCSRAAAQDKRQEPRPVSKEEGEAIAQAALRHWPHVHDKPDCSHLVHDVYGEAGLEYEYAPTGDIFDGIDRFKRVKSPQPGDLVVWEGHVGIVIDPDDTSFYSSVISGFSVSSFTSAYWLNRGPRRFYRYLINGLQSARLLDLFG